MGIDSGITTFYRAKDVTLNDVRKAGVYLRSKATSTSNPVPVTKHVDPIKDNCPDYYDIVKKETAMSFQTLQILVQQCVLHDIDDIEIGLQHIVKCALLYYDIKNGSLLVMEILLSIKQSWL